MRKVRRRCHRWIKRVNHGSDGRCVSTMVLSHAQRCCLYASMPCADHSRVCARARLALGLATTRAEATSTSHESQAQTRVCAGRINRARIVRPAYVQRTPLPSV